MVLTFTVTKTEITHVGTCQDVNHNKVIETNRENDKQETWLLMELQKIRRQMEHCEARMTLKNLLLTDQGSTHNITVKINELKVGPASINLPIPQVLCLSGNEENRPMAYAIIGKCVCFPLLY